MSNKNKTVGRPAAQIKYPRSIFTLNDLFEMNHTPRKSNGRGRKADPAKICKLTIIKHVDARLADNTLTKLPETVHTGKPGKPAFRYILTSRLPKPAVVEAPAPVVEAPVAPPTVATTEIPLTEAVPAPAPVAPAPAVEAPSVVDATLAALTPVI